MTSHHDEKYLDFAAAYVLRALDGDELREFEEHLRTGCKTCASEVTLLTETVNILPIALPQSIISPDLKERVLFAARLAQVAKSTFAEKSAEEEQSPVQEPEHVEVATVAPQRRSWLPAGLAFAAVVIVLGAGFYVNAILKRLTLQQEIIDRQETKITELISTVDQQKGIMDVIASRKIKIVMMNGMKVDDVCFGKIIWDPARKIAILHVTNLPAPPQDRDYQLWAMKGERKMSAGVFEMTGNEEHENFFRVQAMDVPDGTGVDAFAVTLEPKGGMPQPTGEMYLMGKSTLNQ